MGKHIVLVFFILLGPSGKLLAQYPLDSLSPSPIDSVALKDSIRKFTLAHIDTSFMLLSAKFDPKPFHAGKQILSMQVETIQSVVGIGFLIFPTVILLALIILVKLRYKDYFDVLFKNTFRFASTQSSRDWSDLNAFGSFLLNIVYVFVTSIYLFSILKLPQFHAVYQQSLQVFLLILVAFTTHYVFRLVSLKFLGHISAKTNAINLYISQTSTINQFTGLCVLPLMIFIQTGGREYEFFLIILVGVIYLMSQLLKYLKGLVAGIQELSNDFFHFIIYICTLEIAPVLIIVKLVSNFSR